MRQERIDDLDVLVTMSMGKVLRVDNGCAKFLGRRDYSRIPIRDLMPILQFHGALEQLACDGTGCSLRSLKTLWSFCSGIVFTSLPVALT